MTNKKIIKNFLIEFLDGRPLFLRLLGNFSDKDELVLNC